MCGLVGYVGLGPRSNFAKALLIAAQVRGVDATGYIEVAENGFHLLKKRNVKASRFVESFKLHLSHSVTFLGHTRKATCGGKGPKQAHPYIGDRFILMHNGWFTREEWRRVAKTFDVDCPNGVDSEMFLSYLEATGSIEELRDKFLPALSTTEARYMLVIFDKQLKQIHFLKDGEQVFSLATLESGAIIYGSTPEILQNAGSNTLQNASGQPIELVKFPPFTHLVVDAMSGAVINRTKIPHPLGLTSTPEPGIITNDGEDTRKGTKP